MIEHKHCKICNLVIDQPGDVLYNGKGYDETYIYYHLEICIKCIIKKGMEYFGKRKQKEKN